MKTHFDPYTDIEDGPPEIANCGTRLGEECDLTWNWKHVTCKRCLAKKSILAKWHQDTEDIIVKQMGDMAKFTLENKHEQLFNI